MITNNHLINLRYIVAGIHFDAAIDISGSLGVVHNNQIIIELFCLDYDWDTIRIYQTKEDITINKYIVGDINTAFNSFIDFSFILENTKNWIKQHII